MHLAYGREDSQDVLLGQEEGAPGHGSPVAHEHPAHVALTHAAAASAHDAAADHPLRLHCIQRLLQAPAQPQAADGQAVHECGGDGASDGVSGLICAM